MRFFLVVLIPALLLSGCESLPSGSKCSAAPTAEMKADQAALLKSLPDIFVKRYPVETQQRTALDIQQTFQQQGSTLRPLFDLLAINHPYVGKLTVAFALTPAGEVATAQVTADATQDPIIDGKILPALKKIKFPAACGTGYFDFEFPFAYEAPADGPPGLNALRQELGESLHKYLVYPIAAVEDSVSGIAIIRLRVSREGTVAGAALVQTSGSLILDHEAITVWSRLPKRGLAIPIDVEPDAKEVTLELPIRFDLSSGRSN